MSTTPQLAHRGDGLTLFTLGPVAVHVWTVDMSAPLLRVTFDTERALLAAHPAGIAALMVNRPRRFRPPDAASRAVLAEVEGALADHTLALCVVVEGSGLINATARAVMSAIQFAARSRYPSDVTTTVDDGAAFVARHLPAGPTAAQIVAAVQELAPR